MNQLQRSIIKPDDAVGRDSVQPFLDARAGIFDEIFPDGRYPTATRLVVEGLVRPDLRLEISAVAVLP